MNIISNFKDYYDFVAPDKDSQIVYARDYQKLVNEDYYFNIINDNSQLYKKFKIFDDKIKQQLFYEKELLDPFSSLFNRNLGKFIFLSFCDKQYNIFVTNNNEYIYTLEEFIEKVDPKKKTRLVKNYGHYYPFSNNRNKWFEVRTTNNNKLLNTPIVINNNEGIRDWHINQNLSEIQFTKVFKPIECYQEIYNWLSEQKKEPEMPNSPTDMERYEGKGFDKITSFRKM